MSGNREELLIWEIYSCGKSTHNKLLLFVYDSSTSGIHLQFSPKPTFYDWYTLRKRILRKLTVWLFTWPTSSANIRNVWIHQREAN